MAEDGCCRPGGRLDALHAVESADFCSQDFLVGMGMEDWFIGAGCPIRAPAFGVGCNLLAFRCLCCFVLLGKEGWPMMP